MPASDPTDPMATMQGQSVALLTCSMAADLDLFALLAASVDRHVDPVIRHDVVVPAADLAAFRRFETRQRRIIAQEDVLPERLYRLPPGLRRLASIRQVFRRPLYLSPKGRLVRGWMVQQCLKIGMSCASEETAIIHVDSDVAFFRRFAPEQVFDGPQTRFFRAQGATRNPMHGPWLQAAAEFLGCAVPDGHQEHYIENCVIWDTRVARAMVAQIEAVHGRPLHEVIFAAQTMSEYYLYGLFAAQFPPGTTLAAQDVSLCNSFWPSDETAPVDFDRLRAKSHPQHRALAIQSTHAVTLEERAALYARAARELA